MIVEYNSDATKLADAWSDNINEDTRTVEHDPEFPCLVVRGLQLRSEFDAMNLGSEGKFPVYVVLENGDGQIVGRADLNLKNVLNILYTDRFNLSIMKDSDTEIPVDTKIINTLLLS